MTEGAAGADPAVHKGHHQTGDHGAGDPQMGVSPLVEVVVVQVHSAHVAHLAVYHHYLAVVLSVDAHNPLVQPRPDVRIGNGIDSVAAHVPVIGTRDQAVRHIVKKKAHFYAFLHFLVQQVPHFAAGPVVSEAEILYEDELPGPPEIFQEKLSLAKTGSDDFQGVTGIHLVPFSAVQKKLGKGAVLFRHLLKVPVREKGFSLLRGDFFTQPGLGFPVNAP